MQEIIVEKPYRFIPPHRGNWVPSLIQRIRLVDRYLNHYEGVASYEIRNIERLKESVRAGHGVILAPNHCRYADPLAMGWIARAANVHVYAMASWHLFHQGWLQAFAIRMCGGFSVYREGSDRQSLDTAINAIVEGKRPLVIFPEGTVFRSNDLLQPLLDGVSFLARAAARKRRKLGGDVVIHPVGIKYLYRGNVDQAVEPVLSRLEKRLTWEMQSDDLDLLSRIKRVGEGLLSLKEIQFLGAAQSGALGDRKRRLIERLLAPLEEQWLGGAQSEQLLLPRIKLLRIQLVPKLLDECTPSNQKVEIRRQLADIYQAQMVSAYPEGYLDHPTTTRVLETVERFDEDVL